MSIYIKPLDPNRPIDFGTRMGTMFFDFSLMMTITAVLVLPLFYALEHDFFKIPYRQIDHELLKGTEFYIALLFLLGIALLLCKDIVNERSIAKRVIKLQLVNHRTGQVAQPWQYVVRNLLLIIWPIEVIVAMIDPERRLGDRLAGTRLVRYDPSIEQPKPNFGYLALVIFITYVILLGLAILA
jgi:hypothetical protein